MRQFIALIHLFRPINLFLGTLSVLISAAVLEELGQTGAIISAILVVVSLNAAANAFNDYRDLEMDRINRSNRPLPSGIILPVVALWSAIILFLIGIIISYQINLSSFIIATFITTPLLVSYSLWFKGRILVGNVVVSFTLGLVFIFSGAALGNIWGMVVPAWLAFGFTLLREFVKDMADIEGDRSVNLNTFPIKFGLEKSVYLAITFIILLSIGTLLPFWLNIYGKFYLITLVLGIEIPLLYIILLLMNKPSIRTFSRISQILKACIFAGLLAVYLR